MEKILLIEDDKEYGEILEQMLSDTGYEVTRIEDSIEGLEYGKNNEYDLIISDLYLDKLTGAQVIEMIKMYRPDARVLMISNSVDTNDEIKSLRVGANDFVKKDSPFEVFLARVKNLIAKKSVSKTNFRMLSSETEGIEIDQQNRLVKKDGQFVHLTNVELDLLIYMLQHKNALLSRENLIENVWKVPVESSSIDLRTVDAHIKNLRRKLNLTSIFSVRGIGYRWYE